MPRTDLPLEFHDLLVHFQRKRRFIAAQSGIGSEEVGESLSYGEEAILYLLHFKPDLNVKEVAEALKLERSWVSRVVVGLEERDFIRSFVPPTDKRSKKIRIHTKGKEILARLEKKADEIMEGALSPMSKDERKEFAALLNQFAENLKAPTFLVSSSRNTLDEALSRVSWALGVYGNSVLDSELNITQIQILYALDEAKQNELVISDLDKVLPFDMSTISRSVEGFRERGYVQKVQSSEDKRSFILHLAAPGREQLKLYREKAQKKFAEGLRSVSSDKIQAVNASLGKVVAAMPQSITRVKQKVEVRQLSGRGETAALEQFLPKTPAPQGKGEQLAPETYGIYCDGEIRGAVRIFREQRSGSVQRFYLSGDMLSADNSIAVLRDCLKEA